MNETLKTDLCVIGAGAAGLSVAAGAAQMGAETILIEKGRMGGDCLNYGCVPSKALLAAAKAAHHGETAGAFGVRYPRPEIDFAAVRRHVQEVIAAIAPNDSVERFEALGVRVIKGAARFVGPDSLAVDERRIVARRIVVATGSSPLVPPIEGLSRTPYFTNETIFDLETLPAHLVVIGGGPIGCELSQAFRRLGAKVSLVEMASLLPKDDPEPVALIRERLGDEGITLYEGASVTEVAPLDGNGDGKQTGVRVTLRQNGQSREIAASHLLLAAGRRPNVEGLDLDRAGIAYDSHGIVTDARLRTSNRKVFAAGDIAGGLQFTHLAGHHAGVILKNALFRLPAKVERRAVPWVTYTDPELAQVGMTEAMARDAGETVNVLRWPFAENDRAQTERTTEGAVKVVVTPKGRILGASIVGPQAGELILPWTLAIANRLKIGAMATVIAPYPTLGEAGKRAAGNFYAPKLFNERTRRIVRWLAKLG